MCGYVISQSVSNRIMRLNLLMLFAYHKDGHGFKSNQFALSMVVLTLNHCSNTK